MIYEDKYLVCSDWQFVKVQGKEMIYEGIHILWSGGDYEDTYMVCIDDLRKYKYCVKWLFMNAQIWCAIIIYEGLIV
jgi:hypothetical protein